MNVIKLEYPDGGFYLCSVNDDLLEKLGPDPNFQSRVCDALKGMGHEPCHTDVSASPLVLTLLDSDTLCVGTADEPDRLSTSNLSDLTIENLSFAKVDDPDEHLNTLSLGDVSIEQLSFDDVRSPPRKQRRQAVNDSVKAPTNVDELDHTLVGKPTEYVEVRNVEEDFIKDHFLRFINRSMAALEGVKGSCAISCTVSSGVVSVKFESPSLATKFTRLVEDSMITYEDGILSAKQVMCDATEEPTSIVIVSGVAEDFIPAHLVRFLKNEALKFDVGDTVVGIASSGYMKDLGGASVTFSSAATAAAFCEAASPWFVEYEGERLIFKQKFGPAAQIVPGIEGEKNEVRGKVVEVTNLPPDFIQAHFIRFLKRTLSAYNIFEGKEDIKILSVKDELMEIELPSEDIAAAAVNACHMYDWKYEDVHVGLRVVPRPLQELSATTAGGGEGCSKKMTEYEEVLTFVKVWVSVRHLFSGRNHESAYARMHVDLLALGIDWDVPTLAKKRRNLMDQYKKKEKVNKLQDWDLHKPIAVILGVAPFETLEGTEWVSTDSEVKVLDVAMFTKGAVWTHTATLALISVCYENRHTFLNETTRHTAFYHEVSKILGEKGHFHDGPQCERKMLALKKEYRDEAHRRGQTGAPSASQFPYYDDMEELMKNDVTVTPPLTVAAGVGGRVVASNLQAPEGALGGGRGVKVASTFKRPRALAERRVKAMEDIAEAMQKRYSP